jgi:hypothetical protein
MHGVGERERDNKKEESSSNFVSFVGFISCSEEETEILYVPLFYQRQHQQQIQTFKMWWDNGPFCILFRERDGDREQTLSKCS